MEGIVLKTISYKEKSKIVYLYTPFGMKSVLVHHLQENVAFTITFNVVNFEATGQKLMTLRYFEVLESFYELPLNKVHALMVFLQVIENVEADANHQRIYPFFKGCLQLLYQSESPHFALALFLTKMLAVFGVRPSLHSCVLCGNTNIVAFSIPNGGALCDQCSTYNEDSYRLYQAIKLLYENQGYQELNEEIAYQEVLKAIYSYYEIHVHIKLKRY